MLAGGFIREQQRSRLDGLAEVLGFWEEDRPADRRYGRMVPERHFTSRSLLRLRHVLQAGRLLGKATGEIRKA